MYSWIKKENVQPLSHSDGSSRILLISATKAAEEIRQGKISSFELVSAYISRINDVNPAINAIVHGNFEKALEEAQEVDNFLNTADKSSDEYLSLARKKPLLGIPFTVKDNLKVKGFVNFAGHEKYAKSAPNEEDAEVVKRFRNAGAILLATTNMPKFGNSGETKNGIVGRTNNPHDLRKNPGSSSGGEAALITSAASLIGIGNDFGGSIRLPACMCGIFGLKPTPGIVPLYGIIPNVETASMKQIATIGPMSRYAEDLELLLNVLVESNIMKDNLKLGSRYSNISLHYIDELDTLLCEPVQSEVKNGIKQATQYLERRYNTTAQRAELSLIDDVFEIYQESQIENITKVDSLTGIIRRTFNLLTSADSDDTTVSLEYSLLSAFLFGNQADIDAARNKRDKLRSQLIDLMGPSGIMIMPVIPATVPFHFQREFTNFNVAYTCLANALGLPSLSCPIGRDSNNMPMGVQIIGAPYAEGLIIEIGKELERGFRGWLRPWDEKETEH
ncbi:amidase domain-containing protein [Ditylenchus destructor]|uniref:Amidase domain-containing protein n=1 Tax=Ditylenchus destructor TaxID=166010 RepID=A0AAD4MRZ1_9BILA|nr:amidase domain-containing protein [Ditylenchus destructor]